jgi:cell division septum initiation protein DivIVA
MRDGAGGHGKAGPSAAAIRSATLPKSLRGYDQASTRALLNRAAERVDALEAENLELRRQVTGLKTELTQQEDLARETLSTTILAATRVSEWLLTDAKAEAATIRGDARRDQALRAQQAKAAAEQLEDRRSAMLAEIRTNGHAMSRQLYDEMGEQLLELVHLLENAKDLRNRLTSIAAGTAEPLARPSESDGAALLADIQPQSRGPVSPS